jgi:hypothetical protein
MVLEAEWQQERALARALEAEHAGALQRVPAALFLEQARYALWLRKLIAAENICHIHATSSRALVCGLLVKRLLGLSLTVAIESRPAFSRTALQEALKQCSGGRSSDPRFVRHFVGSFMLDRPRQFFLPLNRRQKFWDDWSQHLLRWSAAE